MNRDSLRCPSAIAMTCSLHVVALVCATVITCGCSLAAPTYQPTDYEKIMGPIHAAKSDAASAQEKVAPAEEAYVDCFTGYALDHSQSDATATEISEAATVTCWPRLDLLRATYYEARSKAARAAELERGMMRPDIAAEVDADIKRTEQLARGKALDLVVRARTPRDNATPVIQQAN